MISHNKPAADLESVPAPVTGGLQVLLATGAAHWSGRKPALQTPLVVPEPSIDVKSLADMVLEDRG